MSNRVCACIDLKSYYASLECMERGLDPLTTRLVVADESRTDKTICLAVSPALKAYGIPGRARLFEVKQRLEEVRRQTGQVVDFIVAMPQMAKYMKTSSDIYSIYQRFVSPDSMHVYSIDEVFFELTGYLDYYHCTAHELVMRMIRAVLEETGITATGGIGTNLYLAKIAMDIVAKKIPPDKDGVRIAELDEMSYREKLWEHRPLTDFWRIGRGTAARLEKDFIFTMGDIARKSLIDEEWFFKTFGVDGELIVDHAWGLEPTKMADIKAYKPSTNSLGAGQVLSCPYTVEKTAIIVQEMTEALVFDLLEKKLVTSGIVLDIAYDREMVDNGSYSGPTTTDLYGRQVPKAAHGITHLDIYTSSTSRIVKATLELFDRIVNRSLTVRRVGVSATDVIPEADAPMEYDLFSDRQAEEKEKKIQASMLAIRQKFGKNAILTGLNYKEGATTRERNAQIGGHKA